MRVPEKNKRILETNMKNVQNEKRKQYIWKRRNDKVLQLVERVQMTLEEREKTKEEKKVHDSVTLLIYRGF